MKTVFITAFQSFVSRNILNTGVLDELLKRDARVVIFVPPAKAGFYRETYNDTRVVIEPFDTGVFDNRKERFLRDLALLLISTKAMAHRKMKMREKDGRLGKYMYQRAFTAIFGRLALFKRVYRWLDYRFNNPDAFNEYFQKYDPDVVFAPDSFGLADVLLLKSAVKRGAKSVGMVASWDNNTTKGLMRVIPEILLIQNEIIKDESVSIQRVPESIIHVVGIPHYDYYRSYRPIPREDFFKRLGISKEKRLVMFTPAGDKFISTDWQVCQMLKDAFKVELMPDDVVILIRIHPTNPVSLQKFEPDEHFIIENPGVGFEGMGDKRRELDIKALNHLLDTLHNVELVINVVSSMVIDAAVLDKPIVTIGFNGWEKRVPFGSSVERYLRDDNMAKLLAIGGTHVAKNATELVDMINKYMANPTLDREGRKMIVDRQCYKIDGHAKDRIADIILNM